MATTCAWSGIAYLECSEMRFQILIHRFRFIQILRNMLIVEMGPDYAKT